MKIDGFLLISQLNMANSQCPWGLILFGISIFGSLPSLWRHRKGAEETQNQGAKTKLMGILTSNGDMNGYVWICTSINTSEGCLWCVSGMSLSVLSILIDEDRGMRILLQVWLHEMHLNGSMSSALREQCAYAKARVVENPVYGASCNVFGCRSSLLMSKRKANE